MNGKVVRRQQHLPEERRNATSRQSDHREREIKAWQVPSLVIGMMGIKDFTGGKSSGRRIGKGGRG